MSDTELVFVYGTLRQGACNAFRMDGAARVRLGKVRGKLYRLEGYPAMVPDEGSESWVLGDLWEVSAAKFSELNDYEMSVMEGDDRVGFELDRVSIARQELEPGFWPLTEAWTWRWTGTMEGLRQVKSGDWMDEEFQFRPSLFTSLGCLSLIAIPVGTAAFAAIAAPFLGRGGFEIAIGVAMAVFVMLGTPAAALFLCHWAERRRERGAAIRGVTQALASIWGFVAIFLILMGLIDWLISR